MRSFHYYEDVYDHDNDDDDDSNPYGVQLSPAAWKVRGHGTYEEVATEDVAESFLELAKLHDKLVVHFCRQDVPECEIMHNHLGKIAKQHLEAKFVHLNVDDASRTAADKLVIEGKLGILIVPTLILVKNQQYVYRLQGFEDLGGKAFSTFTLKEFLAFHGVLKLTEAEVARRVFEAEPIDHGRLPALAIADGSVPHGASIGAATQKTPVGWGPIPSFDFQSIERQDEDEMSEKIGPYDWGPSFDESTQSGAKQSPAFDSRKIPAATFAALGAVVGVALTACSNAIGSFVGATMTTCAKIIPEKVVEEGDGECPEATRIYSSEMFEKERVKRLSLASKATTTIAFLASHPCWVITTVGFMVGLAIVWSNGGITSFKYQKRIQVAFIGNSVQYFNDFPRFMEAISGDHVVQNSCLHEYATIFTIVQSGNGMLKKFNTEKARVGDDSSNLFDYGACTVHQLLFGYDGFLYGDWKSYNASTTGTTYSGAYNDGLNPCYADASYLTYITTQFLNNPIKWDYVVINDDPETPGSSESRQKSLESLMSTYASWFAQTGAIPVFLDTPAYWSTFKNLSTFENVPTFTSLTYEGYREYAGLLGSFLPAIQKPLIAPVGIAFLAVWEDDYQMWTKLFHYDEINLSPHGTFLQGCVVHHSLFGHLPRKDVALPDSISSLFSRARRMQPPSHHRKEWPTRDEALYLYNIAKKVVHGYLPKTFVKFKTR